MNCDFEGIDNDLLLRADHIRGESAMLLYD